jgi:hypothetical protein
MTHLPPWYSAAEDCDGMTLHGTSLASLGLDFALDANHAEGLYDVSNLEVIEVLNQHTTFEALQDLSRIIFSTS